MCSSRRFYQQIGLPHLWRRVYLEGWRPRTVDILPQIIAAGHRDRAWSFVRDLSFTSWRKWTQEGSELLAATLPHLRSLDFNDIRKGGFMDGIWSRLEAAELLRELSISSTSVRDSGIPAGYILPKMSSSLSLYFHVKSSAMGNTLDAIKRADGLKEWSANQFKQSWQLDRYVNAARKLKYVRADWDDITALSSLCGPTLSELRIAEDPTESQKLNTYWPCFKDFKSLKLLRFWPLRTDELFSRDSLAGIGQMAVGLTVELWGHAYMLDPDEYEYICTIIDGSPLLQIVLECPPKDYDEPELKFWEDLDNSYLDY
jgi:hypothetical protein